MIKKNTERNKLAKKGRLNTTENLTQPLLLIS